MNAAHAWTSTQRILLPIALGVLLGSSSWGATARADGPTIPPTATPKPSLKKPVKRVMKPRIVTTIELDEVVRRSPFIFRAKVARVAHVYGVSRRTQQRYTRHHRVEVEVGKIYRGSEALTAYRDKQPRKRIMLQRRVSAPWAKLVDHYAASYGLKNAQVGDEFIAFLQWTTESPTRDGKQVLLVTWVETTAIEERLPSLIGAAAEVSDTRRRKTAACPKPHTFFYAGKCITVTQMHQRVHCPPATALTALPAEPTPRAYCGNTNGTFHGPFFVWRRDGDIATRGEYTQGKRSGTWTDYGAKGKKIYRREYREDTVHGRTLRYHDNGQMKLLGFLNDGKREGRWIWYDKAGKETGSFEMAGGSGTEKTFHNRGNQHTETEIAKGKRHGKHREWYSNGKVAAEGAYNLDRPIGLWKHFSKDGKFMRAECFRGNGGLKWETPLEDQADPAKCVKAKK